MAAAGFLPQPYQTAHVVLSSWMVFQELGNFVYVSLLLRRRQTTFTLTLFALHVVLLAFVAARFSRSWMEVEPVRSTAAIVHSIISDACYHIAASLHVILSVKRFTIANPSGIWYRPIWDRVLIWFSRALFVVTFVPAMVMHFIRLGPNPPTDAIEVWPMREIILLVGVFIGYLLLLDTILGTLMYRRLENFRRCLSGPVPTPRSALHKRTVGALVGMMCMSWMCLFTMAGGVVMNVTGAVQQIIATAVHFVSVFHMTFALIYMKGLKVLLESFGSSPVISLQSETKADTLQRPMMQKAVDACAIDNSPGAVPV
ncbi:hypothetical protein BC832DRAFT_322229 [Gaertneriomyces semiglobifer]|nr:hypothetical protein BC832DRAFT_322229 [Gaertneriomyces semiglobifer]